jgi:hypothetical protein
MVGLRSGFVEMGIEYEPLTKAGHLKNLSDDALRGAIAAALLKHANLTMSGFDVRGDGPERSLVSAEGVKQVRRCLCYLASDAVQLAGAVNRRRSSYGWKHAAESWARCYVATGAFIASAILVGLAWERVPRTPNVFVGLTEVKRQPSWLRRCAA